MVVTLNLEGVLRMKKFIAMLVLFVAFFSFAGVDQAAMVFNDEGSAAVLAAYFNNVFPASKTLVLHLFCTNTTVTDVLTPASFTECSGGGYASVNLTNGSWVISQSGGIEQAAYATQTFTFTGPLTTNGTIYGYYLVDSMANAACTASGAPEACCTGSTTGSCPNVVTAETFSQPFTPANNGDNVQLTPIVQMSHGTPAS